MAQENSLAQKVAQEINRALKDNPQALTNDNRLKDTLANIISSDAEFEEKGGVFFQTGSNAFETAEKFTQIHVEQYRNSGRPSLPALAIHHADKMGLDKDSPEYKALILVSVRAEMQAAASPDYHSKEHYMDVAAMTANLLEKNNQLDGVEPMSKKDQALAFIAAIGHDLDHDGKGNPADNPLFNEEKSFMLMEPLLQEAGLVQSDIAKINTILLTTSPNGPHAVLKSVAKAQREGGEVDFSKIKDADKFPELKSLAADKTLTQMAAVVSDSDLYASGGAGMEANKVMSELLTKELNGAMDFTTDGARKFFLDNIVGQEGFASNAGRAVANDAFKAMQAETNQRLANNSTPKPGQ